MKEIPKELISEIYACWEPLEGVVKSPESFVDFLSTCVDPQMNALINHWPTLPGQLRHKIAGLVNKHVLVEMVKDL